MTDICYICCMSPRVSRVFLASDDDHNERGLESDMTTVSSPTPAATQITDQSDDSNQPIESEEVEPRETITQLHAAAVNGDKPYLARLITAFKSQIDAGDQFGRNPLIFCILADRFECAELLLKNGSNVNHKDKGGRTPLHWAAHKGNYRLMKLLLSKGAGWYEEDNEGQTALHLCTRHKQPKCMSLLLRHLSPAEVDVQDNNKRTALHWASSYGNFEHVKMLIKQDSNIGIPDIDGKTPLHWAASSRDKQAVNCVKLILETTPSVINWQDFEGRTALHLSVADGNESIVNVLTSVPKCDVSALDNMFRTPLHWAAVLGHSKIVHILLEKGADYTNSDSNGATPLHYAAQNNFSETVDGFLSFINVTDDMHDNERRTAFMWAAGKGADEVIKIFHKYSVDLQQVDKNGATALHAAALAGHESTVKILLELGAQIDIEDHLHHTPLFRACEMGHTDVVQTLLDMNSKVDIVDQEGRSTLHWAALGGHACICQILINHDVDPNVRDFSGRTPLQCAAYGGYVNCMSVLIEFQAHSNAQDNEGMTALHWACSKGDLDAVKLLLENNAYPNHMEYTEDRYTALDYALMGEHHDVAQYMIEQGALSITGIQDIAAQKIQSAFRGYRVRKTFTERKILLMKHEKLKKEAARKRAGTVEDSKKKDDGLSKLETDLSPEISEDSSCQGISEQLDMCHLESSPQTHNLINNDNKMSAIDYKAVHEKNSSGSVQKESDFYINFAKEKVQEKLPQYTETEIPSPGKFQKKKQKSGKHDKYQGTVSKPSTSQRFQKKEQAETQDLLAQKREAQKIKLTEKNRRREIHRKQKAAGTIQRAWRRYKGRKFVLMDASKKSVKLKRLQATQEEWEEQIAALTIQLAWRKYYRRKLLNSLKPNKRLLRTWDPDVISAKQQALVQQIYDAQYGVPNWHPTLKKCSRPIWLRYMPSPAAVSYNFAVDQYHPLSQPSQVLPSSPCDGYNGSLKGVKLPDEMKPKKYSYNMQK